MMLEDLKKNFKERYGEDVSHIFFAPGRVNLMGEHIDYCGGFVLSFAIRYGTYLLLTIRDDKLVKCASVDFDYSGEDNIDNVGDHLKGWLKYPAGVLVEMTEYWLSFLGANVLFSGNLPLYVGLSSSASIELVTAFASNEINDCQMTLKEIAIVCQHAESKHVGGTCGVMDQYIVAMAKKDTALLMNCNKLRCDEIRVDLGDYKFVIINTNKSRESLVSKYNERREDCDKVLALIATNKKIDNLSELSIVGLEECKLLFTDELLWKRAVHVVQENEIVMLTANALACGDLAFVGRKMNESHDSLRDNYELTSKEIDILIDEARKIEGVLGSRMTGAGFGVCTISLVHQDSLEMFKERVGKTYFEKTGLKADFYTTEMCEGVKRIE